MPQKILVATLPIGSALTEGETASLITRELRAHDRSLSTDAVIQLPLVSGGSGTIDFLVSHSLGSFLEVEATGATGEQLIVPIGFAGDDGNMGVIEANKIAGVENAGDRGTTFGIGELILDCLDEGAFSILIGNRQPIACDGGMGIGAALGVKFYDGSGNLLDVQKEPIERIARIDATGRSFQQMSARYFVAMSDMPEDSAWPDAIANLASIVARDCNLNTDSIPRSMSGLELGMRAFLNADIREGRGLLLEAAGITSDFLTHNVDSILLVLDSIMEVENARVLLELASSAGVSVILLTRTKSGQTAQTALSDRYRDLSFFSLEEAKVFQAPLGTNPSDAEHRRDFTMRLQKLLPTIYDSHLRATASTKEKAKQPTIH